MPLYEFSDPKNKICEIFFNFADAPSIGSFVEIDGIKYRRIPGLTNNIVDSVSKIDITDAKKFTDVSKNKKGTVGDLFDESQRLSDARVEKFGRDVIKEKFDSDKKKYMDARKARNRARKLQELKIKPKNNE